ncbi:DUF5652 family protein [Gammaproteobacteria bacterium]|nr:DUF5652 family protein [Gammaproteobacteria bacterium]
MLVGLLIVVIWEVYWTFHACWLAAKLGDKKWFLFFLVFQLLAIPEIIYIQKNKKRLSDSDQGKLN